MPPDSSSAQPPAAVGALFVLAGALATGALYAALLPLVSEDMRHFLLPWFAQIEARGWAAMAGEYANYAPPYLYLLGLASLFSSLFSLPAAPVALIKAVSIVFTLLATAVFALIVERISGDARRALVAGSLFPLIPTVALNAA